MTKPRAPLLPFAAAGACLLLLVACAEQKPPQGVPPAAQAVPKPPEPKPAEKLAAEMERLSQRAADPELDSEQADGVLKEMRAVMQAYLDSPPAVQKDPKLQGAMDRMCDAALDLELDANSAPPEAADAGNGEAPTEDLLGATTFLSPEDLKSTYDTVEKALAQVNLGFEVQTNDAILAYVNTFQNKLRDWFERALVRGAPYVPKMQQIFKDEGIPPSLVYLAIVESAFNPNAVSRAKAVGMWQFISGTAQRYGLVVDFWEDQRRDPERAARAAARYLKDLHGMFGDWQFALAAYNCGEGKILRYQNRHPDTDPDFWKMRNSRYLRRETREYVPAIMAAILLANNPKAYGFDVPPPAPLSEVATVTISEATDLRVLARCAAISVEELQALNPSLKRYMTPPRPFELHLPANDLEGFQARLDAVPSDERLAVAMHTVERGESLATIARKYKTTQESIRLANRLRTRHVAAGQSLVIPLGQAASDPALYAEEDRASRHGSKVYKVRRGDTLAAISRRSGVPVDTLRSVNQLTSDELKPGQRIVLGEPAGSAKVARAAQPKGAAAASAAGKSRVHHVQQGDTLWDLARKYGTTVDRICRANRISPGHTLNLGDTLVIP